LFSFYRKRKIKYINQKIPLLLEIIIIVICFGLAGSMIWQYALPPTEEKFAESAIADWQIYRNEEYGFEIKYPNL